MSRNAQQFGSVTVARVRSSADLKRLLKDPWLKTDTIIVKPNWVGKDLATFTDSVTLRMLLEALDGRIIITEGYQIGRSTDDQDGGMKFTVDGKEVNWRWLMRGGWGWLSKHPSWDWFKEQGHWDEIRKRDKQFLDQYGFTDLFNEHGIEYINITEEVWQGRTANPQEIKKAVETRFDPVFTDRLYSYVPQKLYGLRGATFISFAKVKHYTTFTIKNLFGMIPDPIRAWWHGPKNQRFNKSIVDINKIYASLFNLYGICEALRYTARMHPEGELGELGFRYNIAKDLGVLAFGRHLGLLDAVLCGLVGFDLDEVSYIKLGEKVFGAYESRHVEEAKAAAADWFPF